MNLNYMDFVINLLLDVDLKDTAESEMVSVDFK